VKFGLMAAFYACVAVWLHLKLGVSYPLAVIASLAVTFGAARMFVCVFGRRA
jgi:hypothetical protein